MESAASKVIRPLWPLALDLWLGGGRPETLPADGRAEAAGSNAPGHNSGGVPEARAAIGEPPAGLPGRGRPEGPGAAARGGNAPPAPSAG
jgi:hypothetical protein